MNTSSDSDSISDSDSDVTYPTLAKLLCSLELEEYFNEVHHHHIIISYH